MNEESRLGTFAFFISMGLVVFLGIFGGLFVSSERALQAMTDQGFRDPTVTESYSFGPAFYGCDRNDSAAFTIEATDESGERIEATVCCPILSACSIHR